MSLPQDYKEVYLNAHKITIDNRNDETSSHINIFTTGDVGENDLYLKNCNINIQEGALQVDKIQSKDGTVMIDFNSSNTAIDFNGKTIENMTLNLTPSSVATSSIASTNYPSNDLEYELDTIHTNINGKVSQSGWNANKVITTSGGGILTASINTADLALQTDITDMVKKSTTQTITGAKTIQNNFIIDQDTNGEIHFSQSYGLPSTAKITKLVAVPHSSTSSSITISLPQVKVGATTEQLVGLDAIQTLTGKSISGANNTLSNIDYSVLLNTPSIPQNTSDITNNSGFITLTSSGTLENKSISGANNTFSNIDYSVLVNTPSITNFESNNNTFTGTAEFQNTFTLNNHLGGSADIKFSAGSSTGNSVAEGYIRNLQTTNAGYLGFYSGNGAMPSISIANNLKVGIYRGNPSAWLDVNGDIKCDNIIINLPSGNGWMLDGQNNAGIRAVGLYANSGGDGQMYLYNSVGNLRVKFDSNGTNFIANILTIGAIDTSAQLYVKNTSTTVARFEGNSRYIDFKNDEINGSVDLYLNYSGGTTHVYNLNSVSDNRIKHNEKPIQNALQTLNKINVMKYFKSFKMYEEDHHYELDSSGNPITNDEYFVETGFIAQDLLEVNELKYCVKEIEGSESREARYSVSYNDIFSYNVKATQELHLLLQELRSKIDKLSTENSNLKQQIQTLFTLYQSN